LLSRTTMPASQRLPSAKRHRHHGLSGQRRDAVRHLVGLP
jgi:hypothetical protein